MTADVSSGAGSLVFFSLTNSIPTIPPSPLTSPTHSYFSLSSLYLATTFSPISHERPARSSLSMISIVLRAAAQASGFPQYVPPIVPGATASMISDLAMMADSGTPAAIDLAVAMISGCTPASCQYTLANILPVLQKPLCTSSAIRRIPLSSQSFLTAFTHSIGAGMKPPSP